MRRSAVGPLSRSTGIISNLRENQPWNGIQNSSRFIRQRRVAEKRDQGEGLPGRLMLRGDEAGALGQLLAARAPRAWCRRCARSSQSSKRAWTASAAMAQRLGAEQQRAAEHHEQRGGHIEENVEQKRARHIGQPSRLGGILDRDRGLAGERSCSRAGWPRAARAPADISDIRRSAAWWCRDRSTTAQDAHCCRPPNRGSGHARHDAAKLGQRARHVIVRGDHDDRMIVMLRHPLARLGGVVDGVARFLVDIDAAGEELVALAGELLQRLRRGGAVDAGDQQRASPC